MWAAEAKTGRVRLLIRIHAVLMSFAAFCVILVGGFYLYESYYDYELKNIEVHRIIPASSYFEYGSNVSFYAFYTSTAPSDLRWSENVYCDDGTGYEIIDTETKEEYDFYIKREYPDHIKEMLDSTSNLLPSTAAPWFERKLLEYAKREKIAKWRMNMKSLPASGSVCFAKHTITFYTPRLKLERTQVLHSTPWKYGKEPPHESG